MDEARGRLVLSQRPDAISVAALESVHLARHRTAQDANGIAPHQHQVQSLELQLDVVEMTYRGRPPMLEQWLQSAVADIGPEPETVVLHIDAPQDRRVAALLRADSQGQRNLAVRKCQ